ncbi:hypothetical protein SCLCIDRAFT_920927 [Scleroderma citrinum Foug A]|uniref:Uncharacterized protein n=1 Tax=Scleroderma citrinum Foug A TaxID=1036808 RepID=A0A0C2ZH94_9AGAM|nr:hypothetical protein SCLCIDRAFT_920927 [Scleroderma citrinum Foug A]
MRSALALMVARTLFSTINNGSMSKANTSSGYSARSPATHMPLHSSVDKYQYLGELTSM